MHPLASSFLSSVCSHATNRETLNGL